MKGKIIISKRKVKYIRLEVNLSGVNIVTPDNIVFYEDDVIRKYQKWIDSKREKLNQIKNLSDSLTLYEHNNINELVDLYIKEIGEILKERPSKVTFRKMKIRWGSCNSQKKIIILNKNLRYLPEDLIKYVVVHEMCHLVIKNHKKVFWLLIQRFESNFVEKEQLLAAYTLKLNHSSLATL